MKKKKQKRNKLLMLTCRDCRYGIVGLESGAASCFKHKDTILIEFANYCEFYDSLSKREWTWRKIMNR
jgi:hypothetical protein